MKKLILLIITICSNTIIFSQSYDWGKTFGGKFAETINGCATDAQGNVYLIGSFRDTVDFDPGPNVFNLMPNNSFDDIFLLKLDSIGQFQWAKRFGGSGNDAGIALITSGSDVYLAGIFLNQIQLDSFMITQNGSDFASFVCKVNTTGDVTWADALVNENGGTARVKALALDKDGGIYASGYYSGTLSNNLSLYPYTGTSSGFVYKADKNGLNSSIQTLLGDYITECRDIAVDKANNIYVCGVYAGETDFDPGIATLKVTSQNFSTDIFVLKLSVVQNGLWVRSIGTDGTEHANALMVDDSSNVYFTGSVRNSVYFSEDSSIVLNAGSQRDSYIAKLNAQGQTMWAHLIGSSDNQNSGQGNAIDIDNKGNIYVGGTFGGNIDFDFGVDTFYMSTVFGGEDGYVLKLSPDADFLWARRIGGTNQADDLTCIAINSEDYFYVAGTFTGTTNLDPMGDGVPIIGNSVSFEDAFVVKYSMAPTPTSIAELKSTFRVVAYPNPVQDFLYIELEERSPVKIYSLNGQLLKESLGEKKTNIDLSDLPAGVYMLQVQTMALRIVKL